MEEYVPFSWLFEPVDVDEMESDWLDKPSPYGVPSEEWKEFKSQMKEGDEIRAFSSPRDFWENLAGRAGYALVRKGKAISGIVTMMN